MSWIQSSFGSKISPLALFIIVVLAVVFFIAALLHLLIRFLLKQRFGQSDDYPEMSSSGAFQRQLQQLFHLHDSGLDQAYIDALPVFMYKDIMGLKEPFDCPVCLCEFSEQDKLRLLPICSHAFHIDCIDTWLLSNSTCPLCRGVILSPGISFENPVFYFEDGKETEDDVTPGFVGALNLKPTEDDVIVNNQSQSQSNRHSSLIVNEKRVFSVRLGKFKNTSGNGNGNEESGEVGESSRSRINRNSSSNSNSNSNLVDDRRCYSMGSFQYVVGDSELQVALCPGGSDVMVRPNPNPPPPRLVKGRGGGQLGNFTGVVDAAADADGKRINYGAKVESFSVSKIWLWSKKGKFPSSTPTHYPNSINVHLP